MSTVNLARFASIPVALSAFLACPSWAAKWEIVPTLSVGEIYTDNLSLAPDTLKRAEWVTEAIPGISIAAIGATSRFNVNYSPKFLYYARGEGDNKLYQQLRAAGSAELATQLLFVDAGAFVGQENVSLLAPLSISSANTTGNVATVGRYFVSPYLHRNFGSGVQAEARFTYSLVDWEKTATAPSNSVADRINLRLSGPTYKPFAWNLQYVREKVDYETQSDTFAEAISANARQTITTTVGVLAQGGHERYEPGPALPASYGPSWAAGLDWVPSPRTRLAATFGERFFGHTYYLDFRHRTRLTTWSAGYSENISSTQSEFFAPAPTSTAGYLAPLFLSTIPDPEARQKAADEVVAQRGLPQSASLSAPVNFFSGQLFLAKRWQASAGFLGLRNVLLFNAFSETREALAGSVTTGDFAVSSTIRQIGAGVLWNWRMTALNAWNLGAGYARTEFLGPARVDDRRFIQMSLLRQFQPRVSGALNYRRQQNDSNQNEFSYTENAVFATVQIRF